MPETARYPAGLVGAGHISEYHIAALRRLPQVEIIGLHDIDPARAEESARKFQVRSFSSLAALSEAGANVIHVLTPPHTHAAVALEALELGCHVLVEKPLAEDVADCERIQALADARGLTVGVNHSLLFDPQIRRALEAVRQGNLGRLISVDILRSSQYPPYPGGPLPPQYRAAGYPFRDLGVHALYLFQAFLGPIEDVQADWASLGGDPNLAFDEWRALVRCRDGVGQFQLSWNVRPMQSQIILQGTKGVLRVDLFLMFQALRASTPLPKAAERVLNAVTDSVRPMVEVPRGIWDFLRGKALPYHGLQMFVAAFYRALEAGAPVPVSIEDALPVVRWTEEIARAADADHQKRCRVFTLSERVPILITGASGALGSALVERLRAQDRRLRLFVRRPPAVVPEGLEIALGDLGDPQAVDRAVRGAEIVIHAGAAMKGGWIEHQCATITGTRNMLEACKKHGVRKLVHVSSLSVVDWAGGAADAPISETTPYEPRPEDRGAYTRAKLEAERLVVDYTREQGLPAIILRPGQIFGGHIPLLTPAVARRAGKRWLVLGDGRVRLPLVTMDDTVDAILLAAESDLRGGEIIQIVDCEELTQNDVLRLMFGRQARVIRLPRGPVFLLGKCSEVVLGLLGRKSPLAVYRLRSALARRRFESGRAQSLLGWEPRIGVCEGIRREERKIAAKDDFSA
jgi:predicted dehydrogenase/nucleoside-diphosphate-sugar epimerase